jgi:Domain of unknown function (DUF6398)
MTKETLKIDTIKKQIIELATGFCCEYANDEYANLCEKLVNKMSRKRTVPFLSGKPEIWAAAIVHALGTINFLFDKNTNPYASVDDIAEYFGTSKSTTNQKSKVIRDMFKMQHFDAEFSTQAIAKQNPFNRIAMVNGYLVMLDR